ncbi:MAG: hypothetical protein QM703_21020 [Gemmatales bacterium]
MASLVTAMGRYASHTASVVTMDDYMKHEESFAPHVDTMTLDSKPPVVSDDKGNYPWPEPGRKKGREY